MPWSTPRSLLALLVAGSLGAALAACSSASSTGSATSSGAGGTSATAGPGGPSTTTVGAGGGTGGRGTGGKGAGGGGTGGASPGCGLSTILDGFTPLRTLHVSPTGSDLATGLTPATAWATVAHAGAVVQPGDEVRVAASTYGCAVSIGVRATAAHPVWIHSADGPGKAVLACGGKAAGVFFNNAAYVAFDGFDVGSTDAGSHVTHVNSGGDLAHLPDHLLITHNHLHHGAP